MGKCGFNSITKKIYIRQKKKETSLFLVGGQKNYMRNAVFILFYFHFFVLFKEVLRQILIENPHGMGDDFLVRNLPGFKFLLKRKHFFSNNFAIFPVLFIKLAILIFVF